MPKIQFKLQGREIIEESILDIYGSSVMVNGMEVEMNRIPWDVPVDGTIYGTLLNYKGAFNQIRNELHEAPYKEPPKAPILYIKPMNTMIGYNMPVPLPKGIAKLEVGASIGIVIGRNATKVAEEQVFNYIAGYTIVNDISIPHKSIYRPAISQRARDGFCPIGPWIVQQEKEINPDHLNITVFVNGVVQQKNTTANLIRPVATLISEMTQFMTLKAGDIVLVGAPENPPLVGAGDRVRIEIEHLGHLENMIVHEEEMFLGVMG